ncbi:MAG: F0F1 ATP synthase subunit delta [Gemmatimonadetes bacterium]|nr:F0F1 ATP synthase subunit delta [Gemmatimonadota bacterium]
MREPTIARNYAQALFEAGERSGETELGAVVKRGRQGIVGAINQEYHALLDRKLNRVHAGVILARKPDQRLLDAIQRRLSAAIGKEVIPHVREDPRILGGMVVRIGDRVMDGSLRRKIAQLRKQMLGA